MQVELYAALVVMLFIILDFVSGIIKAAIKSELSSTKMREGLMHKLSFILALLLGWLCEWSMPILGLPDVFGAVYMAVAVYISCTEIVSILENLGEINPELKQVNSCRYLVRMRPTIRMNKNECKYYRN